MANPEDHEDSSPRPFLFLSPASFSLPPPHPILPLGPVFPSSLPHLLLPLWLPHIFPLTLPSLFKTLNADSLWAGWVIFLDVFKKALFQVCDLGR